MKPNLISCCLTVLTVSFISSTLLAVELILKNDPKRHVAPIARDLGITPEQFVACFNNVHPASHGERPTIDRAHTNKSVLLPCFQKANPNITNDKLDAVMDRYRPGGHEAQMPEQKNESGLGAY
jgi:hypothetical protein